MFHLAVLTYRLLYPLDTYIGRRHCHRTLYRSLSLVLSLPIVYITLELSIELLHTMDYQKHKRRVIVIQVGGVRILVSSVVNIIRVTF